jgi:hypothetical protein
MPLYNELLEAAEALDNLLESADDNQDYLKVPFFDSGKLNRLLDLAIELRHKMFWLKQDIRKELGELPYGD